MPDPTGPAYLILGRVLRPHGIQGELRIHLMTDYPERINDLEQVWLGKDPYRAEASPYQVVHMRLHQQEYGLLQLKGITDRGQADRLRGLLVMVDLEHAVPLEEDEFYLYQLIGLSVHTQDGQPLGTLEEVLETGANDVYIVRGGPHGELLIPATEHTIIEVDLDSGRLIVDPPEGLLPS